MFKLPESADSEEAFICPFCGAPYRELVPAGTVQVQCKYCQSTILVPSHLGGAVQRCANHPESLAVGACNTCGKNLCGDCLYFVRMMPAGRSAVKGAFYLCKDHAKKIEKNQKVGGYFALVYLTAMGLLVMGLTFPRSGVPGVAMGLFIITVAIVLFAVFSNRYVALPTVRMVMDKMAELNANAEKIKAEMTLEDAESLYKNAFPPSVYLYTSKELDSFVEKHMQQGLSRKDAIFEVLKEKGAEIRLGLNVSPTIDDALSEIRKERKISSMRLGKGGAKLKS